MTKSELREMAIIAKYHNHGMTDVAARALSALIRAARSKASRAELMDHAKQMGVTNHQDFIV